MAEAGPEGLEALLVYANDGERHPLALLSHGSPFDPNQSADMTALSLFPQALEFARRGWTAAVVMRRGYGTSGGELVGSACCDCEHRRMDDVEASRRPVADLQSAIRYLVTLPQVDGTHILAVGFSTGGFDTIALTAALTAAPAPGLVAAISFAGGTGSNGPNAVCDEDSLVNAMRTFGKTSTTPMLWIYAENDHFFPPALARRFRDAFEKGGHHVDLVQAPPFGREGHQLFSDGIALWTPVVDRFLAQQQLTLVEDPKPQLANPAPEPPAGLSAEGQQAFAWYLHQPPHKAFALSPSGHFGWRSGRRTIESARYEALQNCSGGDCAVRWEDDTPINGPVESPTHPNGSVASLSP